MSYTFTVNGIKKTTDEDKPLLRYLRDDLKLYSVKDGCSEGACGTCTIIIDGRAMRSCVMSTAKAEGKEIITVEGLSLKEKEAYVFAFGSCGAVQCGFCIPGMVMSAKALIDQNPDPTDDEIKKAIRGNICRCTGYKKIIQGIKRAAAVMRGEEDVKFVAQFATDDNQVGVYEYISEYGTKYDPAVVSGIENYQYSKYASQYGVGQSVFRVDVRKKVLGYGKYPDDIGPEYFVPEDKPDSILEIAGWDRAKLERAIAKGNIIPNL